MSQGTKSGYYQALKAAGVKFERHYRDYSTEELAAAYGKLVQESPPGAVPPLPEPKAETPPPVPVARPNELEEMQRQIASLAGTIQQLAKIVTTPRPSEPQPMRQEAPEVKAPEPEKFRGGLDPTQHAGVTMNSHVDRPIRVDEAGNQWFRNEVTKPGYAKARGRRVLRTTAEDTKLETITVNGYTETFEIPDGNSTPRPTEIKVTLPSYQTGIYKAPGMPFKIHTYQGARAFDWEDVNAYYGGADLVPTSIKHVYVSSDLCYDITTTIRAIEDEYRERVLKKESVR